MKKRNTYKIKNTKDLFKKLKISKEILSQKQKNNLHKNGFLLFPPTSFMKKNLRKIQAAANKLIRIEGDKGGWEGKEKYYKKGKFFEKGTNRLGNLLEKNKIFRDMILIPEVLAASYEIVKSDIKIAGFNLRNPLKGNGRQKIHIDWKPRKKVTESFDGTVTFVFLDKADLNNGALRIIPGSHKKLGWPEEHIDVDKQHKKEKRLIVKPGTIIVANLNLWHAGANNISGSQRKMIMINIKKRNVPQLLNYKKYLSKKTKKSLNSEQKYLLAIRSLDKTQRADSVGVGKYYRKDFKNKDSHQMSK